MTGSLEAIVPTSPIQPLGESRAAARGSGGSVLRERQSDFASVLSRRAQTLTKGDHAAAREAASDFVAAAFIEPLLKEARANNRAAAPFAPGPAEKQFQGLMDAQMARRIARATNFPLVDRMTSDLVRKPLTAAQTDDVQVKGPPVTSVRAGAMPTAAGGKP